MTETKRKLSARAIEMLDEPNEARIEHINKQVFIPYERAVSILEEMEDLLSHPKLNRMPNILIIGRSNNGKTEILREFLKRHPAEDRDELDTVYAPVVYIQSPPGPSEHLFLNKMLMMLGVGVKQNSSSEKKLLQLIQVLGRVQTKILMIDELNALLAGSVTKQRFFLNMLKYLSNELNISIVAAGTVDAKQAVNTDKQIKSRFPIRPITFWNSDVKFRKLLASFEYILPLKKESEIYKGEVAKKLYGLSEGTIGELANIVRSSAKYAIETGEEKITMDVVKNCRFVTNKGLLDEEKI